MEVVDKTETKGMDLYIPQYVGKLYLTSDFAIACTKKPNPIHLFFMRLILGWTWKDTKKGS